MNPYQSIFWQGFLFSHEDSNSGWRNSNIHCERPIRSVIKVRGKNWGQVYTIDRDEWLKDSADGVSHMLT